MLTDIERGFLLAEDEALKAKLSGITVSAPREEGGRRRVRTWYRMPEKEKVRSYPFITIDLVDIEFAADRAHSAQLTPIDYWPSFAASFADYATLMGIDYDPDQQIPQALWWHPYNLHYSVSTHARSAQHDRELMSTLIGTAYLPDRWGYLQVPADGSERHLVRQGFTQADYLEETGADAKRVFRKVYSITVTADVAPENPFLYYQVLVVNGTLTVTNNSELMTTWQNTGS